VSDEKKPFDEWELFGHARIVGRVTEATIAGGAFIRVDVPDKDGNTIFTRFFGPSAIYSMSPISREMALHMAAQQDSAPVKRYELPPALRDRDGVEEAA
jgi:hypothetical protein